MSKKPREVQAAKHFIEKGMKKILFYLPNLHHGGAEGVMVDVANYLVAHDFDVVFVLVKAEGVLLDQLDLRINVINMNQSNQWFAFLKLPLIIRVEKPNYVFSTMKESNFIAILSKMIAQSEAESVIREANTVSQQIANESKWYQKLKNKTIFYFYRYADHVVALSEAMKKDLLTVAPTLKNDQITVIPNPVDIKKIEKLAREPINPKELELIQTRPLLLSVGGLREQKNYSFLFDALAEYRRQGNEFTFFALGEGPLRTKLETQIKRLALDDCCYLAGYQSNPFKYMKQAEVFLLPSLFEGVSNSLLQAISLRTKVLVACTQKSSVAVVEQYLGGSVYNQGDVDHFCAQLSSLLKLEKLEFSTNCLLHNSSLQSYAGLFIKKQNQEK